MNKGAISGGQGGGNNDWQPLDDSNFFKENELLGGGAQN